MPSAVCERWFGLWQLSAWLIPTVAFQRIFPSHHNSTPFSCEYRLCATYMVYRQNLRKISVMVQGLCAASSRWFLLSESMEYSLCLTIWSFSFASKLATWDLFSDSVHWSQSHVECPFHSLGLWTVEILTSSTLKGEPILLRLVKRVDVNLAGYRGMYEYGMISPVFNWNVDID